MTTQQINISFSSAMADTIRIHTGETGRVIVFTPDILLEQDQSAEIIIVKPDNTFVIDDATIANGLITVTMPEQAGAVSGVGGYILKVYKDSLCVYSASGPLMVDDHLLTDGMIESVAEAHGYVFPDDFLTDDDIEINPTSPAFATLTKIKYKGVTYEVDGGSEGLDDLTDVTLTDPETGEVLTYDGQKWVNEALFIPEDLDDLDDVTITSPENGNVLQYDGTGWKNTALSIPDELSDLSDVAITSPAAGNVLIYNGAAWQNQNLAIPEDLDDLDDVEISAPEDGQQLVYNDGVWENQTITPVISKTATGNPIELTDAASAPLVKCVTQITGLQDLHGYDKPWVGGSGKNILPLTVAKLKADNVGGTWNGNIYSFRGIDFTITEDNGGNVIEIDVNGTSNADYATLNINSSITQGSYILNGILNGLTGGLRFDLGGIGSYKTLTDGEITVTTDTDATYNFSVNVRTSGVTINHHKVYPMIRLSTESDSTFAPYSNICPITAYTEGEIKVSDGYGNVTTHTTAYPSAIYRGSEDVVNGTATTEWGMIASYAGETLPGEWISDRDEYAPGTTPTTGAQVAYELATPTTSSVTPTNLPIKSLNGYTHIESSTGEMEVEYITKTYEPIIKSMEQLIPANTRSIQSTIAQAPQEIQKIVLEDEKEVGEEDAILRLTEEEGGEENADQRLTDE